MLSTDIKGLAKSFLALSLEPDCHYVIGPGEAENFARTLNDFGDRAKALEGRPVPTAKILQFPKLITHPTPGGDAA